MTDLGTLPGGKFSEATDINNSGQIVGISGQGITYLSHAFLYSGGQMIDLGTLPGDNYSWATAINDSGTVVGYSSSSIYGNSPFQAFLYSNGKMTDINSLIPQDSGWTLSDARAINNKGQILGDGLIGGQYHQFLLTPISTTATPKDGITVGNISTQGGSVFLQGLKINLTGSKVVTKGGNITLDGPTILNSSTGAYTFNSAKSTATSKGGDITFKNTLDSNSAGALSLKLTAGLGNITFNNAVGGNASLKDLTVNSAKTFTAKDAIITSGNTIISATQDITTDKLISNSGAVKLTSKQGAVITQDITSDSDTIIAASQRIATGTILTNNGAVKLTSQQSFINTKNITTNGASVTVIAENDITTRNILSNGGVIDLVSRNSSITTGYLRSDSSEKEGDITVLAANLVKVQGSVSINGNNYSIYSGKKGEGFITIQHGGGDTKVPFVVGNATENGTVGAISIGNSTIFPTSSRHNFSGSYTLGNGADLGVIRIISSDNKHLDKSLKELIVAESDDDPFKGLKALEWLGDKIFESVEWTFEAIEDGFTQITNASGGRVVIEAGRELTPEEADIAAKLAKEGRLVEALQEGTSNTKRVYYSDFLVDGVKTELKTVSNIEVNLSATPAKLADKLSDVLLSRMRDAARQADNVIVDARSQPGINRQIAERTLRRAENSIKSLKGPRQIRIIGPDFDLSLSF
jgi:probable HAF family extracellular repeat protein